MSNPTPKVTVEIDKDHRLPLKEMELFHKYIRTLWPGKYELIIRKPSKPKSGQMRKFYWSVMMTTIADELGMLPLEIHSFCKSMFLPYEKDSSEDLTTTEDVEYWEKIRVYFAQEHGIIIAEPNQVDYE